MSLAVEQQFSVTDFLFTFNLHYRPNHDFNLYIQACLFCFIIFNDYPSFSAIVRNEEYINQKSDYVKVGSSDLKIKIPYNLTTSSVVLPLEMKQKLSKFEVFAFQRDKSFGGKITYMLWNKEITYSVEKGVEQAILNVRALTGVEKIEENKEFYKKGRYDGCKFFLKVFRYGKSFYVKGTIVKSGQQSWMIIMTMLDIKEQVDADKILASLQ